MCYVNSLGDSTPHCSMLLLCLCLRLLIVVPIPRRLLSLFAGKKENKIVLSRQGSQKALHNLPDAEWFL